jgi:RNA-directed DNA polymerase
MDDFKDATSETNEVGTPQGGVISPLLANIALHGMETAVLSKFERNRVKVIRYADDFIITSRLLGDILKAKEIVIDFLRGINLELSEAKTRIGHSLKPMGSNNNQVGFDFLGYHFRNITVSVHRGPKSTRGVRQNFRQISSPSKDSVKNHKKALKKILREYKSAPLGAVINRLSSTISG